MKAAINEYIAKPKPFIWTAKASDILAKVTRAPLKIWEDTRPLSCWVKASLFRLRHSRSGTTCVA